MVKQTRRIAKPLFALFLVLGGLACKAKDSPPNRTPAPAVTPSQASLASGPVPGPGPSPSGPVVHVSSRRSGEHGLHLADSSGRPLYMLEQDPRGSTTCYEACLNVWPPFLANDATPTAADSVVREASLGIMKREDARVQVTYYGRALYYYVGDGEAGETRGQHVEDSWGEWYLMGVEGRPAQGSHWQRKKK